MTASLGEQLAQLTPAQRTSLLRRLRQREPQPAGDRTFPLSHAQERLWFLDQLDPGNPAYNIPFALRITGSLDREALKRAIRDVVRRHAALRTAFPVTEGRPGQVVRAVLEMPVPVTDLGHLPSPERAAESSRLAAEHARQRFALADGPLLSVRLLVLGADHLLLVAVHHIVFDGWSTSVFVDELAAHYKAAVTGVPAQVPALPVQFTEWAAEERDLLDGPAMAGHLAHWKRRLTGAPLLSTLPTDRPRQAVRRNRGAQRPFRLDAELTGRVETFARQAGVTLNAAALAAFAAVLRQATGQDELLIGTPVGGRMRAGLEPLIGCFANTLVLRLDLSGDPALRVVAERAHRAIADAYAHQDAPYTRVVEEVAPPRDPAVNPLFQTMFSVAGISEEPRQAGPVTFTLENVDNGLTDFDLFFTLTRRDGALEGLASYDADLYLPGTVDGLVDCLRSALDEFATHPDRPLSRVGSLRRRRVSIAASFTADPVREPADFWLRFLRMPVDLRIAPYGQVVPHLLASGDDDATVCLLRWEDWLRHHDKMPTAEAATVLDRAATDLAAGLRTYRDRSDAPLIVGVCPPSEAYERHPWTALFAQLDDRLSRLCRELGVTAMLPDRWTQRYPAGQVHDAQADALGHVPYSTSFFAVLGTQVVRRLAGRWTAPVHTVVLDPAGPGDGSDPEVAAVVRRFILQQERYGRRVMVGDPAKLTEIEPAGCVVLSTDPRACATTLARFPGAVALTVPVPSRRLARYLDHVWLLDPPAEPGPTAARPDSARVAYLATQLTDAEVIAERSRPAEPAGPATDGPLVAPRTRTEERLAGLWRELLPDHEIGAHSDFFALGGHSLLATRLLSRVHAEFGTAVPLHAFFAGPTVERLAAILAEQGHSDDPIPVVPRNGDLVPSSTQQRLWTAAQIGDDPGRHNITFAAALSGPLDLAALRTAVARLVERHEILRTTFRDVDGVPYLEVHDHLDCWLPEVDLTGVPAAERANSARELLLRHADHHFDLARGPLLRVQALILEPDEYHLLVTIHHIVSDNWSWDIFLRELAALYEELTGASPAGLPPLPVQFADFAAWQRAWLGNAAAEPHVAYWRSRLADAPPLLALPTDRPRPAVRSDHAGRAGHAFAPGLGPALRDLASGESATLFSTLLAGFAGLLQRYSDQDDMVLGSPIAARHRPELEGLIGYFADILPLRLQLTGEPTFRELIRRVHATVVDAYAHQELPFASIVEAVQPPRDPAYHPVFQCLFNFVDLPESVPVLAGRPLRSLDVPSAGTDFDLFLTLYWQGGDLHMTLDYRTDLYDPETARRLLAALEALVTTGLAEPDQPLSELDLGSSFVVPDHRPAQARTDVSQGPPVPVAVAASFTADPLQGALQHCLGELDMPVEVRFGPYAQVFQQLLDSDGVLGATNDGLDVVLLRWEDWLRFQEALPQAAAVSVLERALYDLVAAVEVFRARSAAPLLIGVCPASERYRRPPWSGLLTGLTDRLDRLTARHPGSRVLRLDELAERYGVTDVGDPRADELGHIPYTPEFFAALGTVIAREVCRWHGPALRTIVVEAGAEAAVGWLRRFLHRQRRYGRDIVFDPDGVESSGLASTAVLAIDGRTADEARQRWPEAYVLTLPDDTGSGFADHNWIFDPPADELERGECRLSLAMVAGVSAELADARVTLRSAGAPKVAGTRYVAPRTEAERILAEVWAQLLHADRVGVEDGFFDLGGDSMVAIQVVSQANRHGIAIAPRQLMANPTIAALASGAPGTENAEYQPAEQGPVVGAVPLTPPQRWFLDEIAPTLTHPGHFNHPYYLSLREPVEPEHLRAALIQLAGHHDALRARFARDGDSWRQEFGAVGTVPFTSHDLTGPAGPDRDAQLVAIAAREQAGLNLTDGPAVRAVHFRLGPDEPDRLLLVNHHLVVDAMSRGVLLDDLQTICRQLAAGRPARLPAKTTSYRDWARRLDEYAQSGRLRDELPFWVEQSGAGTGIPVDHPGGQPTFGSIRTLQGALSKAETDALRRVARARGSKLSDLMVAVLATVLTDWTGGRECTMAVAGHGRADLFDGVDLTRTVGWFQVYYPLRLSVPGTGLGDARLAEVGRQLERVPENGIGYGLLRYGQAGAAPSDRLAALPPPQVTFNFMGDFSFAGMPDGSELFSVPESDFGSPQDDNGRWPYLIDVVPALVNRRLRIDLNFSLAVHRGSTAEWLLGELLDRLRTVLGTADNETDPVRGGQPVAIDQKEQVV
ncbi:condensation domain-containing protein [Couchioplanes caeruleus]|uniref:Non-ribosomal peptide synthetase n=2 Tax=Couchioplanes caeruleus TaxID=56438 RepID=A0A1K0FSM0_9ACTN|nr:condensation domain-containing protein [Couchioplanes caeruleus]OJF15769.1 Non-ribosomal peptide synthetase [Couchioplanes caeruleus subsp. caeruleus]ROP31260.1 non-ribosomal peptide synthase protein (TIGR01720 family) [Couchioplanes caeruleus]